MENAEAYEEMLLMLSAVTITVLLNVSMLQQSLCCRCADVKEEVLTV